MTAPTMAGPTPQRALLNELRGMWKSYAIQAAAHYNFASLIGEEHKTTAELAQTTGVQEQWVHRVLRLLASIGIFSEVAPRTYINTPLSACLCDNAKGSLRAMARMMGTARYRREWGLLEETMRTGTSAIQLLAGEELYVYLDKHPDELELFDAAIADVSAISDGAFARTYNFAPRKNIVDLGGGRGSLLLTIHTHHPHIQSTLFERPDVLAHLDEKTRRTLAEHDITLVGGDFFKSIPSGADAYILKEVLHNWNDEQCIAILKQCCQALQRGSVVLVCEQIVNPANNEGDFTKALDLLMGLEQQGGERTKDEYQALFEAAGLRLVQVHSTPSPHFVLEGVRA